MLKAPDVERFVLARVTIETPYHQWGVMDVNENVVYSLTVV